MTAPVATAPAHHVVVPATPSAHAARANGPAFMAVLDALPTAHAESERRLPAQPEPRSSASASRRGDSNEPRRDETTQPATDLYAALEGALASAAILPQHAAAGHGPEQPPVASWTTPAAPLVAANVRASAGEAAPTLQTAPAANQPTGAKLVGERTFHALVSPTPAAMVAQGAAASEASTPSAPAPPSASTPIVAQRQALLPHVAASETSTLSAPSPRSAPVIAQGAAASGASTLSAPAPVSTPVAARPQASLSRAAAASGSNGSTAQATQDPADSIRSREVDVVANLGSPAGRDAAPSLTDVSKDQAADAVSKTPSSAIAASQAPPGAQARQVDPSRQANASTNETPRATDRPSLSETGQANAMGQPDAAPANPLSAPPAVSEKDSSRAAGSRRDSDTSRDSPPSAPPTDDPVGGQTIQPRIDVPGALALSAGVAQAPSDPSPSPAVSLEARPARPAAALAPSQVREIDLDLSSGGLENVSMTMRLAGDRMSVVIRAGSSQTANAIEGARSAIADRLAAIGQPLGSLIIQQTNMTADSNATANRSEGGDAEGRHEPQERSGGDSSDPRGYRRGSSGS